MFELAAGLSGPDYRRLVRAVSALPDFARPPTVVMIDYKDRDDREHWRDLVCEAKSDAVIAWDDQSHHTSLSAGPGSNIVAFGVPDKFSDVPDAIAFLEPLPFETCSL